MKVQHYNFDQKIIDDNLKFTNTIKGFGDTSLDFGTTNLKIGGVNRNFTKWIEPKKKFLK